MKIAMILTNGFDPDPRVYKEAKSLVKLGHNVEILCWDRESKYKDTPEELLDGIVIKRFFGEAQYGTGYKQGFKFLSFKKDVLDYMMHHHFDAIHCHDFDGLFIGYSINKKLKLKLVYDEHDLFYMYFADRPGKLNKIIYNFIISWEKMMLKNVDNHIVVTSEMKKLYENISKSIYVVTNAPSKDIFRDIAKTPSNKLRIGYIGSVRYLEELKILADISQKFEEKIEVIISGRGIALDELKEYCKGYDNIKITGAYSFSDLENLYKNTDITYAFYPSRISSISMPNKFYESIITETPIIANKFMEFGREVEKHKLGYAIDEENLELDLEKAILELISDDSKVEYFKNQMKAIKEDYLWEANERRLSEIYSK
nr:glycosyltransferase [Clostridium swellfunianum]